ncbi:MAG: TerC/Alx family metal homeostasis membrane protein [Cyclobacteriaceae bacterium]|jgi:tellurite resistance protein TerC
MENLSSNPFVIGVFAVVVLGMLILDLGVFNKKSHEISNKEAIWWSVSWIGLSMLFSGFLYLTASNEMALETFAQYQTAYWIEKALSVDNLFVFILVFNFFNVRREYQHKVLYWGIIGAIIFRAIFIFVGVEMINFTYLPEITVAGKIVRINLLLLVFGFFLVYAGIKSWFVNAEDDEETDFSKSPGARMIYRIFPVSKEFDGDKFFTIQNGKKLVTPLFVVVGVVEFTDVIFAVDSIPAIFSVSRDPFILYTSNIFAILGLRSLFFLLANFMHMFSRLKFGLAIILAFIGAKMVLNPIYHMSSTVSLLIVLGVLVCSFLASIWFPIKPKEVPAE